MNKAIFVVVLFFQLLVFQAEAYKNIPVVLVSNRVTQLDTLGYNFVDDMANSFYKAIESDLITIYDSPEKKRKLTFQDLKSLESSYSQQFVRCNNVFIYEEWTSTRKKFSFDIKGFAFATQNENKEEILFGYVELDSGLINFLKFAYLKTNANGDFGITLHQVLMNKTYDFDIVFFNRLPITDIEKSRKTYRKTQDRKKTQSNYEEVRHARLLKYTLQPNYSDSLGYNYQVIKNYIEAFFNNNPQEFLNIGGDAYFSYLNVKDLIISRIDISEVWINYGQEIIERPLQIQFYLSGVPLNPILTTQFNDWGFLINGETLNDVLLKKQFEYDIIRINGTDVPIEESDKIKDALSRGQWTNLLQLIYY